MTRIGSLGVPAALVAMTSGLAGHIAADTVAMSALRDNSIFELYPTNSNGAGAAIFTCKKGDNFPSLPTVMRGLLVFDVADSIPPGSTIMSAKLKLTLLNSSDGSTSSQLHTLQRLVSDWGEGLSQTFNGPGSPATDGDATWLLAFFPDDPWDTAGGDFSATISASTSVGNTTPPATLPYTWGPTSQLRDDVQDMLDNPASNFGWILRGNETTPFTARKFSSREHPVESNRPVLTVEFMPPCPADLDDSGGVEAADLAMLLGAWGPCPPPCTSGDPADTCAADLNGDCMVNAADLAQLLGAWGPC